MRLRTYSLLIAGALAIASAGPAAARDTERVRYADLDLSRPEGVAELNLRVARVAKRICYRRWDGGSQAYHACRKSAVADARRLVDAALARSGVQIATQ